ncbi:exportin-2-like [Castanea sativa]|uniref:exportin-2-like n=1 Tax=Castanea sativa TaxID=21020 RepID=UPI003F65009B
MEWNPETLQFLSQCFLHTLSPVPEPRRIAESSLSKAAETPNYGLAVLRLVSEPSVDEQIRQAASVNFKNHLRARWAPASPDESSPLIPDSEKAEIKALIVRLMLSSTPKIQYQLSESLALIGKHDFPKSWPTLLPELIVELQKASQASDYASINGILGTANSIFKKFRYEYKTNDLLLDLKYCLDNFAAPLLEIFLKTAALIDSAAAVSPAAVMKPLFESQRLCCRIFYSLNFQELPEFFEDHMKEWMTEFRKYLITNYPVLENSGADGLAIVDELRAAVCENINLYMEKNEEEFQVYLNDFALAVWSLLGTVTQSSSRDQLAVTAIKFLTTVSTSVHHALFAGEGVILQICQSTVVPNVRLREEDEELFELNYVEFIRRDMEGSDLDTRRRIACELLKGIATNYKQQVTEIVSAQIQHLLASYAANPVANWKDKDCAIYLVGSLATKKAGGSLVSTDLVDVQSFFASVIVPELKGQDVNGFPMLKAGALKFFRMFRNQISKEASIQIFRDLDRPPFAELDIVHCWNQISKKSTNQIFGVLVRFLVAKSNVVRSYAADCIEKLLLVKDDLGGARYTANDIASFFVELMTNLFNALKFPEFEENQYIMKCIMRVLGVAEISSEVAGNCISGLTSILLEVCKNPKNPAFNHYLFESMAILVKRMCERDPSLILAFDAGLFPSLQLILVNGVTELFPYVFQLLAQLIELNRPPIPPGYMQIFEILLSPESWKKASNVPETVRLLQAFLQKAPDELKQEGRLIKVLEIFKTLISSPSTAEQGFYVLNTVIESLEYDVIEPSIRSIWAILFEQLQKWRAGKLLKSFLILMSLFVVKHGSMKLVDSMNSVQANIFSLVVKQLWVPNLEQITGAIELKLTAVASTRFIDFFGEPPALADVANVELWGIMLNSTVTLLSRPEQDRVEEEQEMPDSAENVGYTAPFVRLYNAGKKEEDPLKDIEDPKEVLVASLAGLSSRSPGRYPQIINQYLDLANQAALLQLCSTYNRQIV